jgi:hypothetical protein
MGKKEKKEVPVSRVAPEVLAARHERLLMKQNMLMSLAGMSTHTNTILDRAALLRAQNSERDLNFECGYPDQLDKSHYKAMYDREGLATRVVKLYPEESWKEVPKVYEDEDAEETEFEKAIKELDGEHNLFSALFRIDILSGIGKYGILLIGLDDGLELREPVEGIDEMTGEFTGAGREHKLLYLRPFDESCVTVQSKETNPASPRFGFPKTYRINFGDDDTVVGGLQENLDVHWSRVIHVADNRDVSEVYGVPRMKTVYNRLVDVRKVLAGSGEMFWKGGFPGYAFEINPDITEADLDADSLKEQFRLYSEGLQRYLAIEGVTAKSLEPQVADPTGHITCHVKAIAMSLGAPYRIFLGTEEAKLASSQDKNTWNERVRRRQVQYLSPMIVRPFFDRLIAFKILPEPKEYFVDWPDLDAPGDKDIAEIAARITEAMAKYQGGGVDDLIPPTEFLTMILKMSSEEAEAIEKARKEYLGEKDLEREADLEKRETEISIREEQSRKTDMQREMQGGGGENED